MQKFFKGFFNLSSTVYRVAIVRFILSMGNFIYPFMTLFLVKKLNISPSIASIYFIASGFAFVPASIISGKLADSIGRRIVLLSSFFVYILIIFSIFFLYHFNILQNTVIAIMLIVANLFLSMTQVPIAAILTDVTDLTNRNEAFSLTYLAANAGFAFGPIIAGFLFENYTSMIFLGNGIASLIGFIIFCGIKETKPDTMAYKDVKLDSVNNNSLEENLNIGYISAIEASINQDNTGSNIENKAIVSLDNKDKNIPGQKTNDLIFDNETDGEKVAIKNQSIFDFIFGDTIFLLFIIATIFFSFAYSQAGFTLPIFLSNLFSNNGAKLYGVLQSTNALTVIFLTPLVSLLTKKRSSFLMIAVSGLFYAFGFGLYSVFNKFGFLIFTTVLWSIGEIIQVTHQNVFIANRSPIHLRGQVNGAFQILSGIGYILGPIFSGFTQKNFPITYVWATVFIICIAGSIQLLLIYFKNKKGTI
ncbi:MAG: MFS transporter [Spirochaetes bacterium]|nr:MFS transporter [Spirochaetota bacterium]